jgi:hypothetical protein
MSLQLSMVLKRLLKGLQKILVSGLDLLKMRKMLLQLHKEYNNKFKRLPYWLNLNHIC